MPEQLDKVPCCLAVKAPCPYEGHRIAANLVVSLSSSTTGCTTVAAAPTAIGVENAEDDEGELLRPPL
jgi:hypothetical protein